MLGVIKVAIYCWVEKINIFSIQKARGSYHYYFAGFFVRVGLHDRDSPPMLDVDDKAKSLQYAKDDRGYKPDDFGKNRVNDPPNDKPSSSPADKASDYHEITRLVVFAIIVFPDVSPSEHDETCPQHY
jgi:hypothetical protein